MRSVLLIILASVITIACQQRAETNEASSLSTSLKTSDSLIIQNEEMISNDPFGLGDSILTYLSYNKDIDTLEVFENPVEDHEGDTTQVPLAGIYYKINCNGNTFSVYKRSDGAELFDFADVINTDFRLLNEFYIGMSKSEFLGKLNMKTVTDIPGHLLITDEDNNDRLHFQFKEDRLIKISYDGYLD